MLRRVKVSTNNVNRILIELAASPELSRGGAPTTAASYEIWRLENSRVRQTAGNESNQQLLLLMSCLLVVSALRPLMNARQERFGVYLGT